jgi:hypothetical protein
MMKPTRDKSKLLLERLRLEFNQIVATNYNPKLQTLLLYWGLGSILVTGPKAEMFSERFCEHKVALVKVDGKDITSVCMAIRESIGGE